MPRIRAIADRVMRGAAFLIDDFYEEIGRHPDAAKVITGGAAQIANLKGSLKAWLQETFECRGDAEYVSRRWKIGLRHAEIGLHPAYTRAAVTRLRQGLIRIVAEIPNQSPASFCELTQSINKLLDLDLAIIQEAYHAEFLTRETLAEHERGEIRFRVLVEAAACMVVILTGEDTIAYFSPYGERLTGYSEEEVIGQHFLSLFVPESRRTEVAHEIAATMAGRLTSAHETPILCRNGSQRWIGWNAQQLAEFAGVPAVLVVGQDFTERRDAQERLLRSERLAGIGQMVTGIAHESRNALQRIQSCSEMLELEVEGNEEAQRLLRKVEEAQDNLVRLFDEVRGYACANSTRASPSVVLESVWREAWQLLETARRGRDAALIEADDGLKVSVPVDRFRMVQVFRNLMENSLAACRDPLRIQIRCRDVHLSGQPAVQVVVRDNGPGLPPAAPAKCV